MRIIHLSLFACFAALLLLLACLRPLYASLDSRLLVASKVIRNRWCSRGRCTYRAEVVPGGSTKPKAVDPKGPGPGLRVGTGAWAWPEPGALLFLGLIGLG